MIVYTCTAGHITKKLRRVPQKAAPAFPCPAPDCYHEAKRQLVAPSQSSKIVMDNGHQARAVEILPNIVEINEERSNKDYRNED